MVENYKNPCSNVDKEQGTAYLRRIGSIDRLVFYCSTITASAKLAICAVIIIRAFSTVACIFIRNLGLFLRFCLELANWHRSLASACADTHNAAINKVFSYFSDQNAVNHEST